MAVDMDKMKRAAKAKKRMRPKAVVDWDAMAKYDGDGDTTGLEHDGAAHHISDRSVLLRIDGAKYFVPFSQIFDIDDEAVIVTDWWWGVAEAIE